MLGTRTVLAAIAAFTLAGILTVAAYVPFGMMGVYVGGALSALLAAGIVVTVSNRTTERSGRA